MDTSGSKTLKDSEVQHEVDLLCLGTKIRKLRQRRSMTLQEVPILSGLSKSLLSQIENDASVLPLTTLIRIAKAPGVKTSYIHISTMVSMVQRSLTSRIWKIKSNALKHLFLGYD